MAFNQPASDSFRGGSTESLMQIDDGLVGSFLDMVDFDSLLKRINCWTCGLTYANFLFFFFFWVQFHESLQSRMSHVDRL